MADLNLTLSEPYIGSAVSPDVETTSITGGTRVTITDKDGAHVFDVMDGEQGPQGDPSAAGAIGTTQLADGAVTAAKLAEDYALADDFDGLQSGVNANLATRYLKAEQVGTITGLPSNAIVQGLVFVSGVPYVVASDNSATVSVIAKLDISDWSVTSYSSVTGYPHINSLCAYDGTLYGCSANGNIYTFDPSAVSLTNSAAYNMSTSDYRFHNLQIVDSTLAIGMYSGTNIVQVFGHNAKKFYPLGSFRLPFRGTTPVQDSFINNGVAYQLYSSANTSTQITAFTVMGEVLAQYAVDGIVNLFGSYAEGEAICYDASTAKTYIIDTNNVVYEVPLTLLGTSNLRTDVPMFSLGLGVVQPGPAPLATAAACGALTYYKYTASDSNDYYLITSLAFPASLSKHTAWVNDNIVKGGFFGAVLTSTNMYNGQPRLATQNNISGELYTVCIYYNRTGDALVPNAIRAYASDGTLIYAITSNFETGFAALVEAMISGNHNMSSPRLVGVHQVGHPPFAYSTSLCCFDLTT